jgi:hypothetical protein
MLAGAGALGAQAANRKEKANTIRKKRAIFMTICPQGSQEQQVNYSGNKAGEHAGCLQRRRADDSTMEH